MGARGFFGGLFGDVNSTQAEAMPAIQSGVYSLDDQYYSKQEGGWWIPYTGTVTGGTVYPGIDIGGSPFNIHKFTHPNSSTLTIASPPTAGQITDVDITVVAGGGGGGGFWNWAGGGGGGYGSPDDRDHDKVIDDLKQEYISKDYVKKFYPKVKI